MEYRGGWWPLRGGMGEKVIGFVTLIPILKTFSHNFLPSSIIFIHTLGVKITKIHLRQLARSVQKLGTYKEARMARARERVCASSLAPPPPLTS